MAETKEVEFERTYDAPVDTVWEAWTKPELLKQWWGPNDVNIPECQVDLKVGGEFYIVMEAGEGMGDFKGTRWPMKAKFTEIEENSRLAYDSKAWTEGEKEATEIDQSAVLTLSEDNGKTKMKLIITVHKVGPKAGMAIEGMNYGFNQQFDKLTEFLKKQ